MTESKLTNNSVKIVQGFSITEQKLLLHLNFYAQAKHRIDQSEVLVVTTFCS